MTHSQLRFLADHNLDNDILRGLLRRVPDVDVVRAHDIGMQEAPDPELLHWAVSERRVLLTHDVSTMPGHVLDRLRAGLPVAGVCIIPQLLPIRDAIEELLLIAECSFEEDWQNQVFYLPL